MNSNSKVNSPSVSFVLRQEVEATGHRPKDHFTDFHPISAVGACHEGLEIIPTPVQGWTFIDVLRRCL